MPARLTINFVTPLPPAHTDIANHAAHVLPLLSELCELTVWTPQPSWLPMEGVRVRRLDRLPDYVGLNAADMTFFDAGNNPDFHADIFRLARRTPGVVILHDTMLQHFFAGLSERSTRARFRYLSDMARFFGPAGVQAAQDYFAARISIEDLCRRYPLFEPFVEGALAAVIHDASQHADLQARTVTPIVPIPLSYRPRALAEPAEREMGEPYRLIMFGYLSSNRRVLPVLNALANFAQRDRFRLEIYGKLNGIKAVATAIKRLGLGEIVTIKGWVSEAELEAALARAHLAINLRFPSMGEVSGSQLRIWSHALPALVTQTGWYGTQPNDTVFFVRPETEVEDITTHLSAFLREPMRYMAAGRRGRQIVLTRHQPRRYAEALIELAGLRRELHARRATFALARRASAVAESHSGAATVSFFESQLASHIHGLFSPGG